MEGSGTAKANKSSLPTIAGILLIIAGILALITWGFVAALGGAIESGESEFSQIPGFDLGMAGVSLDFIGGFLIVCGIIGVIFALIALFGGIMAIQKKKWAIALLGSIIGLFTIGPWFLSSILSLIGLILIAVTRQEFI